jgi:invasion protein IalB
MLKPVIAATIFCTALLQRPPVPTAQVTELGPWTLNCTTTLDSCRLTQTVRSEKHPQTMSARVAFFREDEELKMSVTVPPLFVRQGRFRLDPSGDEFVAPAVCDKLRCVFTAGVGRTARDKLFSARTLTIITLNPLGGEEVVTVDVSGLEGYLGRLPIDL